MPKLKVTMPETGEVTHELVDELITLGRISENIIQIEDASVSSRHAQLSLGANGNYALKDLNSTNGTRVNGAPATEAQLRNGDRVRFGQIECAYFSDDNAASRRTAARRRRTRRRQPRRKPPADEFRQRLALPEKKPRRRTRWARTS